MNYLPAVYPSTRIANLPSQREKGERVYTSLHLHEFHTSEPTSSLAQEKILVETPRENSHSIEKLPDQRCPPSILYGTGDNHVETIQFCLCGAGYIRYRPSIATRQGGSIEERKGGEGQGKKNFHFHFWIASYLVSIDHLAHHGIHTKCLH